MSEAIRAPRVTPTQDHFWILPDKPAEQTEAGVQIPKQAASDMAPRKGTIVAIGENVAAYLKVGTRVMWDSQPFSLIELDGQEYFVSDESSIAGVLMDERREVI